MPYSFSRIEGWFPLSCPCSRTILGNVSSAGRRKDSDAPGSAQDNAATASFAVNTDADNERPPMSLFRDCEKSIGEENRSFQLRTLPPEIATRRDGEGAAGSCYHRVHTWTF